MILAAIGCCLGAAAYAATRPDPVGQAGDGSHPLQPRLTEHPDRVTAEATARFDSAQPGRPGPRAKPGNPLRFECLLDNGDWEPCGRPVNFSGLRPGPHQFELRAVNAGGRSGPAARFTWRVRRDPVEPAVPPPPASEPTPPTESPTQSLPDEPTAPVQPVEPIHPVEPIKNGKPFTIEQIAPLADLLPGEPAQPLALRLTNPNPEPISVVSLTVSFAADPPGCPAAENFTLVPSDVSPATPLTIAAESSIDLPTQAISAPSIAMLELPVDQNACQGANLELKLEGQAEG
jgi:hypothetical protein